MNERPGEQMALVYQFKEDHQGSSNPPLSHFMVDSDKDFSIDEFRNRIKKIRNRRFGENEERFHDVGMQRRCLLDASQRADGPWEEATGKNIVESEVELERVFGGNCSSESVVETLRESEKKQRRKLTERDRSLDNLALYYGLKSDVILSSEKTAKQSGDGGSIRRHNDDDHTLGFEIHRDQVEIGGAEERLMTSYYPHTPLSESEVCDDRGDVEDETMSLFYEFHDLPHEVEDTFKADDEDDTSPLPVQNSAIRARFSEAERTTEQNEEPLARIISSRKRGSDEFLLDQDEIFDDHLLLCSAPPPQLMSLGSSVTYDSRAQRESLRTNVTRTGRSDSSSEAGTFILANGSRRTSGKRARYSMDMTSSIASDEPKWNDSGAFGVSSLDPLCHFYEAFRDSNSKATAEGERSGEHSALLNWISTESVCSSESLISNLPSLSEEKLDEDFKFSQIVDGGYNVPYENRTATTSIPESFWNNSSSMSTMSTTQGFNFASDIELSQLVAPSAVFPATLDSSDKTNGGAWSGEVDSASCLSFESFITSFLDNEPEENGYQNKTGVKDPQNTNHKVEDGRKLQNFRDPDLGLRPVGGKSEVQWRIGEAPLAADVTNCRSQVDNMDGTRIALSKSADVNAMPMFGNIPSTHSSLTFQAEQPLVGDSAVRDWSHPYQLNPIEDAASSASLFPPAAATAHQHTSHPSPSPHLATSAFSEVSLPRLLNQLPFPLPPIPTGYKLVITHQSLPSNGGHKVISPKETRIIIIHPATEEFPRGTCEQPGINTEAPFRNIPASQYAELKYQQASCNTPQPPAAAGLRRPRDFDLPCKRSLPDALIDSFRLNDYSTTHASSPANPVLDLSLSSVLPKIQTFQKSYSTSPSDQSPKSIEASDWTKTPLKHGISSTGSTLKAFDSREPLSITREASDDARICRAEATRPSCAGLASLFAGQTASQASTPSSSHCGGGGRRSLRPASTDLSGVFARTGLNDVLFPPNVVVFSPQCCGQVALGRQVNSSCSPQMPCSVESMDRSGPAGHSSPPTSVEPDSTVHPGQAEKTRDIIRALGDKIRRNRTQRLHSDSLVSTTYSPDRTQSPSSKSAGSLSPDSEPPHHLRPSTNPKSTDNVRTHSSSAVPGDHQQRLNRKSTTPSNDKSTSDVEIKTETSPSGTANRNQLLQSTSSVPGSSLEGIHNNGNNENDASESKDEQKILEVSKKRKSFTSDHPALDALIQPDTPDLELNRCFFFFLDAPMSTVQRQDEDKITYLNKGQYYRLSLECQADAYKTEDVIFRSVVMVLNRDSRAVGDELEAWKIWHTRQQSYKQRILDIDYKDACGVGLNSMDELAYNATALTWSPADQPVRVNVAVNCLSTDFSNQKGVKGIPLHIQIDTYDISSPETPICRAYCKIKVFCDKGAERKVRDDERKRERRNNVKTEKGEMQENCCSSLRQSNFHPVEDQTKDPILFTPSNDLAQIKPNEKKTLPTTSSYGYSRNSVDCDECNGPRRPRAASITVSREYQKVLLYVREVQEEVFTALLLQTPTLSALAQAIHEKCDIETNKIKNIYKKSRKGILVKMDDKILRHYSNESTFVITAVRNSENPDSIMYDVILAEIDVD